MKKEGEEQHNLMNGYITLVSYLHSPGARYEPHAATALIRHGFHGLTRIFEKLELYPDIKLNTKLIQLKQVLMD